MASIQIKPLVLLHSRSVTEAEKKSFFAHFVHVTFINEYTLNKKLTDYFNVADSVLFIDLRKQDTRDWYAINCKMLDENDPIVLLKAPGDEVGDDLLYKYECKRVNTDNVKNKQDLLFNLFQTAVTTVVGKKTKLFKTLLNCVCGSLKD